MNKIGIPLEGFADKAREAAGEGAVLLMNEDRALPVRKEETVSLFGRCQIDYYRSGTGSGGLVSVPYTTNLLGSLRAKSHVVNESLAAVYEAWIAEHPFDDGGGAWAAEPWNQQEMPVTMEMVKAARAVSEKAVIVIGRTAGEDQDNAGQAGSLRLTQTEEELLKTVNACFDQVILILNISNIIDMGFMGCQELSAHVKALLLVWQGGMEGGNAAADLLLGNTVPSGKLPDTIALRLEDYPCAPYYGNPERNCYVEDIYVGYRYFETFCPEKVMFAFGYGISYTDFSIETRNAQIAGGTIRLSLTVRNTGAEFSGKEVVQVYYEAPQGRLGQPARQLLAYQKTGLLAPGSAQDLEFVIDIDRMHTYDDSGISGAKSAYVMEAGDYHIYMGNSVRQAQKVMTYTQETFRVTDQRSEVLAPTRTYRRMKPGTRKPDGTYEIQFETVPTRTINISERIKAGLPSEMTLTGDRGISLKDVQSGRAALDDFIAQLTKEELAMLVRGEGMDHPEATPGTTSVFGSVGESLIRYGIPLASTADGPSGIRMRQDLNATQLPIGTLLAATFNTALIEELYIMEGRELVRNEIDLLLGPGINIHRSPLNGRNFEYYSEDPFLTGSIATSAVKGIKAGGADATVKHFACNNQETARRTTDAVVSERAVREIYLRGFEMAVRQGNVKAIMTSYNPLNGHWTPSNYDLNTTVLRHEWGFDGIVMTDWWAEMNHVENGGPASERNLRDMVRAGNDLYMVVNNYGAEANSAGDDILSSLEDGTLHLGELQQRARYILGFLINTAAMTRPRRTALGSFALKPLDRHETAVLPSAAITDTSSGGKTAVTVAIEMNRTIYIRITTPGIYQVYGHMMSIDFNTAQTSCELSVNGSRLTNISVRGTEGRWITQKLFKFDMQPGIYSLRVEEVKPHLIVDRIYMEAELPDV